jgi:hypothetical protein
LAETLEAIVLIDLKGEEMILKSEARAGPGPLRDWRLSYLKELKV